MKKHLKWIIPVICIVLAATVTGGYFLLKPDRMPTEIRRIHASNLINSSDPRQVVGSKNYIFIGYVTETYDYFTEKDNREFPDLINEYNEPMTECVVKVIKNLKGNLTEGATFSFYKGGGVDETLQYIELFDNDFIPEVGKYYIFTGYAHADGTVTGGGENGTIALEQGIDESNFEQSANYQKYVDAVANEIRLYPELYSLYLSKNDRDYGDGSYNAELLAKYEQEEKAKQKAEAEQKAVS